MELKQTEYSWSQRYADLSSFFLGKVGLLQLADWDVKNTSMTMLWVHTRPFTTLVPYSHQHMI